MKQYIILIIICSFFLFNCMKKDREWNNPMDPDFIGHAVNNIENLVGTWNITSAKYNGNNIIGIYKVTSISGSLVFNIDETMSFSVQWTEGSNKSLTGSGTFELLGPTLNVVFNQLSDYHDQKNILHNTIIGLNGDKLGIVYTLDQEYPDPCFTIIVYLQR